MKTVRAVYENGVLRPTESLELPEHTVVEFEPRLISQAAPSPENGAQRRAAKDAIYEILSRRYDGGDPEVSARHNEHQP